MERNGIKVENYRRWQLMKRKSKTRIENANVINANTFDGGELLE